MNSRVRKASGSTKSSTSNSNNHWPFVNSQRGWFLFFFGIIAATFLGGAIRVYFSPQHLSNLVREELARQNPKFSLEFDLIKLSLADGLWPQLGIHVVNLQMKAIDPCVTRSELTISDLYLPFDVKTLINGRLRFKTIRADLIELVTASPYCAEGVAAAVSESPTPKLHVPKTIEDPRWLRDWDFIHTFMAERFAQDLQNSREWLRGLEVSRFNVFKNSKDRFLFSLSELELTIDEQQNRAEIHTDVEIESDVLFKQNLGKLRFGMILVPEEITSKLTGHFYEGSLGLTVDYKVADRTVMVRSEMQNIPASHLIRLAEENHLIKWNVKPKSLWLSCAAHWNIERTHYLNSAVEIEACDFHGSSGLIKLSPTEYKPFTRKSLSLQKIAIENLDMTYLMQSIPQASRLFNKYGRLMGQLDIESWERISFDGEIKDSEVIFSRGGVNAVQTVPAIGGRIDLLNGRVSGVVTNINLEDGEFAGELSFNFDRYLSAGLVQVQVSRLVPAPNVQKVLTGGSLAPIEVYGQVRVEQGTVKAAQLTAGASEVLGIGWLAKSVKVKTEYVNPVYNFIISASKVKLWPEHPWQPTLRPLYGSWLERLSDALEFQNFYARFLVGAGDNKWTRLSIQSAQTPLMFSSTGSWDATGEIVGSLFVDSPKQKMQPWEVGGKLSSLTISPPEN